MRRKKMTIDTFVALDREERVKFAKRHPAEFLRLLGQVLDFEAEQPTAQKESSDD